VTSTRKEVPIALENIIEKALSKDPEKRYESVDEFLAALEEQRDQLVHGIKERRFAGLRKLRRRKRLTAGVAAVAIVAVAVVLVQTFNTRSMAIDAIAVLPVTNLSGDPDQEYFSDGFTDALINELGQIGALTVISRHSVMQFKETKKLLPEIAEALNVDAVVEASVMRSGNQLRITAQLIRANPERQLWARSYERNLSDVLALHRELARTIAGQVRATLTPQEEARLARTQTVDPEAYEAYLRGRAYAEKTTPETWEKSFEYLERSIELDPTFAPAHAQLATAYCGANIVYLPREVAMPKATAAVEEALALDSELAETHSANGMFRYIFEWDWDGADQAFRRALELNPNSEDAHRQYGMYLAYMGRFEEALQHGMRAVELAPFSLLANQVLGWTYYVARRYDESITQFRKTIALLEEFPNPAKAPLLHMQLAWAYIQKGMYERALEEIDEWDPDGWTRAWVYVETGRRDEVAEQIERILSHRFAPWHAALFGEKDLALQQLEVRYMEHNSFMLLLKVSPELDNLRGDPRYDDLMRRMSFPQ
jgi:TolB-like protein/Tfp pilus assembly protein PilF